MKKEMAQLSSLLEYQNKNNQQNMNLITVNNKKLKWCRVRI